MPVAVVKKKLSKRELLSFVRQMSPEERDAFIEQAMSLPRPRLAAPSLSKRESELLLRINQSLPEASHRRFHQLNSKRRRAVITPAELKEFQKLAEQFELADAERLKALTELARYRRQSLERVMRDLEIPVPRYE